jgi:hypothetical protein
MEIIKFHKYWYSNWHKRKGDKDLLNRDNAANIIYLKCHLPKGIK